MWQWTDRTCELYHYGVKGMKWGVRRFQNKDGTLTPSGKIRYSKSKNPESIDDFRLSKNETIYRWSTKSAETFDHSRKYASYLDKDIRRYGALFDESVEPYLYAMTPVKNLKVAGYKKSVEAILEAYGNMNASELADTKKSSEIKSYLYNRYDGISKELEDILDLQPDSIPQGIKEHGKKAVEKLLEDGYDAMIDPWDKTTGFGNMPIILLNPGKSIESYKSYDFWSPEASRWT